MAHVLRYYEAHVEEDDEDVDHHEVSYHLALHGFSDGKDGF